MNIISYIFSVAVAACAVGFTMRCFAPAPVGSLDCLQPENGVFHTPHPMERRDLLPLALICLVYTAVAFIGLGSTKAPETYQHFTYEDSSVTLSLKDKAEDCEILHFCAVTAGEYLVELSADGSEWHEQGVWEQGSNQQFKWYKDEPVIDGFRYIRITELTGSCYLGEVAVRGADGTLARFITDSPLTDEQDTVPEHINYMNSSYFDEIYHPRTALEYLLGETIYEVSHPPLGKGIISLGIRIFGMNPFGWRFMGTLCGVLMLPILYIFLKNLFGRTAVAACATVVFAFDFMHYVQTRIATIDSYTVFFVLLMFWLMYRWFTQPLDAPVRKTAPWLFAAGAAFGVGAACKWSVLYGGAGLAVVWLIRMLMLFRHKGKKALAPFGGTVLLSVVFFVIIPATVYYVSYQPYGAVKGCGLFSREYLNIVLENQKYMFSYHSGLDATHPYESRWWQWIFDIRPILYYLEYFDDNTKSTFGAFGNPLFWWSGLGCMISLAVTTFRRRDVVGLLILIGWLSNLLPWVGIQRCAFVYHYFPCTVFLALAVGWQMEGLCRAKEEQLRLVSGDDGIRSCDKVIYVFAAMCVIMFILFYPVLSGMRVGRDYCTNLLRWFGGRYPF